MSADLIQAARFLAVLAGDSPVTFQTFSDREELKVKRPGKKDYDPNAHIRHRTLAQHQVYLEALNRKYAGVYVMANEGDGRGRTAKNVVRVRALFIDTDGAPLPADLPLKPHIVVMTSPGRWHLYWLIDGLELADFATLQKALAEHYGTDPSIHDLPRVMRLPGFYHCKAEPVMVQLLEAHDHAPYSPADIFGAWAFLAEALENIRAEDAEKEKRRAELLRLAAERRTRPPADDDNLERRRALGLLQAHHDTVAAAGDGTRHEALLKSARALGGYIAGGYLERHEVEDYLKAAAKTCELPDSEAADVITWGLDKGADEPLELTDWETGKITFLSSKTEQTKKPRSRSSRVHSRMRGWARGRA